MSVEITFEGDGGHGLVAVGTSLWEAAKRLGVHLPADCNGRGECDACAVLVIAGAELLSPANDDERKVLGAQLLGTQHRLACQTTLDRTGAVAVRLAPEGLCTEKQKEAGKVFRKLPLSSRVGALIELQAIAVTEAANALREKSNALIEKFLNLQSQTTNAPKEPDGKGDSHAGIARSEGCETDGSGRKEITNA